MDINKLIIEGMATQDLFNERCIEVNKQRKNQGKKELTVSEVINEWIINNYKDLNKKAVINLLFAVCNDPNWLNEIINEENEVIA